MSITGQPLTIHQFHYRASLGEAVTRHMLFIQEALSEVGIGGKIFSVQRKNLPQGKVHAWSMDSVWDCDLLLIHHSQYNPSFQEVLSVEIPKAVVYHSQSPEHYFSHDLEARKNLQLGKKQLIKLGKRGFRALAVSSFSAAELEGKGFQSVGLIPLMHLKSNSTEINLSQASDPKHLLFVGKLAPHKKQALLIETFFHLQKHLPTNSKLHLVGTGDPLYTKYLKLLIKQLGLSQQVSLTGKLTDSNLKDYYSLADAFVCMSEHEGFCLPVVEAMNSAIPVFYRPLSGIKETMGGAGVELLTDNPIQNAMVLKNILENPSALRAILGKQEQRVKDLSAFQNKRTLQKQLIKLCDRKIKKESHEAPIALSSPDRLSKELV